MTAEELKALPKVELHCHLDGSLSHTFIEKDWDGKYHKVNSVYLTTAEA